MLLVRGNVYSQYPKRKQLVMVEDPKIPKTDPTTSRKTSSRGTDESHPQHIQEREYIDE